MTEVIDKRPRYSDSSAVYPSNTEVSLVQLNSLHARLDSKRQEISALKLEIQTLSRDRDSLAGAVSRVNSSWVKIVSELDTVLPSSAFGREVFTGLPIRVQGAEDHQLLNVLDQQRRILKDKISAVASFLRSQTTPATPEARKMTDKIKDLNSIICDFAKQAKDLESKCFILQREKEELDRLCESLRVEAENNAQKLRVNAKAASCKCTCHCGARDVTGADYTPEVVRKCREEVEKWKSDFDSVTLHKRQLEEQNARMSVELRVSEERFLSTRSFKRLVKQTQILMDHVARLKTENEELRKEREDTHDELILELNKIRRQEENRRGDLERKCQELTFRYEREVMSRQAVQAELEGLRKEQTSVIRLKETENQLALREAELESLKRRYKDQKTQREELETRTEMDYQKILDLQDAVALKEYQLAERKTETPAEPAQTESVGDSELRAKLTHYREELSKSRELLKKQEIELNQLKSRESHLRSKLSSEKTNYRRLIEDMECTNKGYDEAMKQNKILLQQTKDHDQMMAKIMSERIVEDRSKHLLEEEAKEYKRRVDTQVEVVNSQKAYIHQIESSRSDLEQLIKSLQSKLKDSEGKLRDVETRCAGELKTHEAVENAQKQSLEMCREYEKYLISTATEASQLKFHNAQLTSEVANLRSKLDALQSPESSISTDLILTEELLRLRKMTRCVSCAIRMKDLVLGKCFHAFCRPCIENRLGKERDCPVCRHTFSEAEIREIWW